jgi:hypothetical protein
MTVASSADASALIGIASLAEGFWQNSEPAADMRANCGRFKDMARQPP